MSSQSIGGVLGAIVAAVVLAAAFYYVPVGPFAKPAPAKVDIPAQPVQTVPVAPVPRGPVVREVPN
jgi:hypothetical protein